MAGAEQVRETRQAVPAPPAIYRWAARFANSVAAGLVSAVVIAFWLGANPLWVGLGVTTTIWLVVAMLGEMSRTVTRRLDGYLPIPSRTVLALVAVFQEPVPRLKAVLDSLLNQDYPGKIRIVLVDDGSYRDKDSHEFLDPDAQRAWRELDSLYRHYEAAYGITVIRDRVNRGKRFAQGVAMSTVGWAGFEMWFTTDSDTVLAPDTISKMTRRFTADPRVGVVSARILARTPENLVERVAAQQLLLREARRRPAESALREGASPGGPVMMMRREIARGLWHGYQNETFRGIPVTAGEDMYLTLQTLLEWGRHGPRSVVAEDAVAITDVPDTWSGLKKQYLRWTRDEARSNLRLLRRELPTGLSAFTRANLLLRWIGPVVQAANIALVTGFVLNGYAEALLVPITAFVLDALTLIRVRAWRAVALLPVYFAVQPLLLITRLHGLCTARNSGWLTRVPPTAIHPSTSHTWTRSADELRA